MAANPLNEYLRLREAILSRKVEIEAELQELAAALAATAPPPETYVAASPVPLEKPQPVRNAMSLGDAVFSVSKEAPISKEEILTALDRLGYRFAEKVTPFDEISAVLQLDRRFEEANGRYGPTLTALFPET